MNTWYVKVRKKHKIDCVTDKIADSTGEAARRFNITIFGIFMARNVTAIIFCGQGKH